jgi:PST family polysaccharide transporter
MDFKKLALRDVAAVILSGAVGIYMAYNGFGVWSLVYQLLSFTVFNACLLWLLSSWRPRFEFAMADIRDIFHFSANLTGFEIVNYFSRNIDQLLIGKFLGSQVLGYYSIAYKIMLLPLQNISWVAGRVMFPAFSRIQDDLEKVRKTYMKMAKAISLATFPIMLGLFAMAPEMVHVVLGLKWEPVVILLRIFSVCGMIQSVGTTVGNIFLSQHRADMVFHLSIVSSLIVGVSVAVGLRWGINGVALCYTLQALVWSHAVLIFATRLIGLKFSRFYSKLTVSYMIGITVLAVTLTAKYLIIAPEAYKLGLLVSIWAVTYVIALFATKELSIKNNRPVFSVINENI